MDRSALCGPTCPDELPLSDSVAVAVKQYFAERAHRFQDAISRAGPSVMAAQQSSAA